MQCRGKCQLLSAIAQTTSNPLGAFCARKI